MQRFNRLFYAVARHSAPWVLFALINVVGIVKSHNAGDWFGVVWGLLGLAYDLMILAWLRWLAGAKASTEAMLAEWRKRQPPGGP